ncbi:MAG: GGDEF domain-containing protein [Candidatus Omnitrophota bacterium]
MLYWIIIILALFLFIAVELKILRKVAAEDSKAKKELLDKMAVLHEEIAPLRKKIDALELENLEHFFFYDLMRKLAPFLDKKSLSKVFLEEIRYLGEAEIVEPPKLTNAADCLSFSLGNEENIYIKTKSKKIYRYQNVLSKMLGLCAERVDLYDKFQQLSIYDSLTECYNRRYFTMRLLEEFSRAQKFSLNISFIMTDIDNFKKINDTYGHLVGDVVLKEIAKVIKENVREIDSVARLGGEEFAIIFPETDKTAAIIVAERIRSRISQKIIKAFDEVLGVTISAGVASFPQNTLYSDVLMEIADKALYQAKQAGKNQVSWF